MSKKKWTVKRSKNKKTGASTYERTFVDNSKMTGKQKYKLAKAEANKGVKIAAANAASKTARVGYAADAVKESARAYDKNDTQLARLQGMVDASQVQSDETGATGQGNAGNISGGNALSDVFGGS